MINVQGNGTIKTISINKKLGAKTRMPQVFDCYDLLEGLIDEEEDLIFETKPVLFSIGTIIILKETISLVNVGVSEIRSNEEFDLEQGKSYKSNGFNNKNRKNLMLDQK